MLIFIHHRKMKHNIYSQKLNPHNAGGREGGRELTGGGWSGGDAEGRWRRAVATSRGGGAVDLQRRRAVAMGGGDEQGRLLGRSAATMGGGDKQGRWHRRAAWRRLCSDL